MHELSIAISLLEAAELEARRHGAMRITRILCRIGVMRQVDTVLLTDAFEIAKQDSLASEAALDVESVGTRLDCRDCGLSAELTGWQFACPNCASTRIRLSGGEEIELTTLELELPNEDRSSQEKRLREKRTRRAPKPSPA